MLDSAVFGIAGFLVGFGIFTLLWTWPLTAPLYLQDIFRNVLSSVAHWGAKAFGDYSVRTKAKEHLQRMNRQEKQHCRYFVEHDGAPLPHNPGNGAIASLYLNKIIWRPKTGWHGGHLFEFNIYPWVLEYLREHPELLAEKEGVSVGS